MNGIPGAQCGTGGVDHGFRRCLRIAWAGSLAGDGAQRTTRLRWHLCFALSAKAKGKWDGRTCRVFSNMSSSVVVKDALNTSNDSVNTFCRQIRARSAEHRAAVAALRFAPGQVVSILRQELDSMIRVIFLLAQNDMAYRNDLIEASVSGKKWTAKGLCRRITDREMVELANKLHGWTHSVYQFGCGFIHLSNLHDYRNRDPLAQIAQVERAAILEHLRYYHGGPSNPLPTFDDLAPLLPNVFEKIADNLGFYLRQIENHEVDPLL